MILHRGASLPAAPGSPRLPENAGRTAAPRRAAGAAAVLLAAALLAACATQAPVGKAPGGARIPGAPGQGPAAASSQAPAAPAQEAPAAAGAPSTAAEGTGIGTGQAGATGASAGASAGAGTGAGTAEAKAGPGGAAPGSGVAQPPPQGTAAVAMAPQGQKPQAPLAQPSPAATGRQQPPVQSAWLASALRNLSSPGMPGRTSLVVRRLEGRPLAAIDICLVPPAAREDSSRSGDLALGMALAARGRRGDAPGTMARKLEEAGARLELKLVSPDALALELVAPPGAATALAAAVLEALADPAFVSADFPQAQFDSVMRDFRLRRLREEGDPLFRAARALKEGPYKNHPYAASPLGNSMSLVALDRGAVASAWPSRLAAARVVVSAVGDLDAAAFAAALSPSLAAIARLPGAGQEALPQPLPVVSGTWTRSSPGAAGAWLRADFTAPAMGDADYAPLLVALAMLDDLMMEELRPNAAPRADATASRTRTTAYAAYSRLNPDAAPSGSILVARAGEPGAAKAAVERAVSTLASGLSLSPGRAAPGPVADGLEAYKARTLARLYSRSDGAAELALRVARDLAAGGDGSSWFRLADKVAAVRAEDVVRVVKARLVLGPVAWAIAAPPALLQGSAR